MKILINYCPQAEMYRLRDEEGNYITSCITYWGAVYKLYKLKRIIKRGVILEGITLLNHK